MLQSLHSLRSFGYMLPPSATHGNPAVQRHVLPTCCRPPCTRNSNEHSLLGSRNPKFSTQRFRPCGFSSWTIRRPKKRKGPRKELSKKNLYLFRRSWFFKKTFSCFSKILVSRKSSLFLFEDCFCFKTKTCVFKKLVFLFVSSFVFQKSCLFSKKNLSCFQKT